MSRLRRLALSERFFFISCRLTRRCEPLNSSAREYSGTLRKLLHAIFGMFKHQAAFDGNKLYPLPTAEISTREAAA